MVISAVKTIQQGNETRSDWRMEGLLGEVKFHLRLDKKEPTTWRSMGMCAPRVEWPPPESRGGNKFEGRA